MHEIEDMKSRLQRLITTCYTYRRYSTNKGTFSCGILLANVFYVVYSPGYEKDYKRCRTLPAKLFLLGGLVVLFFFWRSYDRKDRYDFQNYGFKARCDTVTGEVYCMFGDYEFQLGVPKSDNQ